MQSSKQVEKEMMEAEAQASGAECTKCYILEKKLLNSYKRYLAHIHYHRLGTGDAVDCPSCVELVNKTIFKIKKGIPCQCDCPACYCCNDK